ncbi:MAG: sporulation membrane protein YtaF [Paenibacillaceae bacterium]
MMLNHLLQVVLIGIASNLDNAGVGIAYGVRGIRISKNANFVIAMISFLMTLLSGIVGAWLAMYISPFVCHLIGAIVIVSVGIYVLYQPFRKRKTIELPSNHNLIQRILQKPEEADLDHSKTISFKESLILGSALGINALAGGFDAGVTHLHVLSTSVAVGFFSFVVLGITDYIGRKYITVKFDNLATILSGILLILIGFYQI